MSRARFKRRVAAVTNSPQLTGHGRSFCQGLRNSFDCLSNSVIEQKGKVSMLLPSFGYLALWCHGVTWSCCRNHWKLIFNLLSVRGPSSTGSIGKRACMRQWICANWSQHVSTEPEAIMSLLPSRDTTQGCQAIYLLENSEQISVSIFRSQVFPVQLSGLFVWWRNTRGNGIVKWTVWWRVFVGAMWSLHCKTLILFFSWCTMANVATVL